MSNLPWLIPEQSFGGWLTPNDWDDLGIILQVSTTAISFWQLRCNFLAN
jgi:hypothetical protein